jgi:4-amino-4-deoxy-L-arabinose transferase-like glycosyltransferase
LGWIADVPWIVNPILLLVSICGISKLTSILYDDRTAILASALFIASPFVLLMGAGFMSHMAALCASIWCFVFLASAKDNWSFWVAGILAGFAFLVRPYTAIMLLWPIILWGVWRRKNERLFTIVNILGGFLPVVVILPLYNSFLYGSPVKTGYDFDPTWNVIHFSFTLVWENLSWYIQALHGSLWRWPFPEFLVLIFLLKPRTGWKRDLLLLVCSLSLLFSYCFLSYRDIVYAGPRFVFEITGFLAILFARGFLALYDSIRPFPMAAGISRIGMGALIIFPLVTMLPKQIQYHSEIYHGQSHEFIRLVNRTNIGRSALILISGDPFVFRSFFFENFLIPSEGARVFVRALPGKEPDLIRAYPRDQVWRVTIELKPLPGPNPYPDHFLLKEFGVQRLQ